MKETGRAGVEAESTKIAEGEGWLSIKLPSSNRNGYPDRWQYRDGQCIPTEYKAPGKAPTRQQLKRHRELFAKGFPVAVIDHPSQAPGVYEIASVAALKLAPCGLHYGTATKCMEGEHK